jgi:hypothetical protein
MYWARLKSSWELMSTRKDRGTLKGRRDASLNEVRSQRKQQKRGLSLENDCDVVLDEIKTKGKGLIESILKDIITDLVGTTSSAFNDLTSSIYGNSFDSSSSALTMPIGLVSVLDPWSMGSALQTTTSATDEAGTVGTGDCNLFVSSEASAGSPRFLLLANTLSNLQPRKTSYSRSSEVPKLSSEQVSSSAVLRNNPSSPSPRARGRPYVD